MSASRSHSLAQLVETTGFDRRTIVYYIQAGLVPRVGRRGPHTRYPDECLQRLQFIKGVKELQSSGRLLTATLAEIRRVLDGQDPAAIRSLLDRGLPATEVETLFGNAASAPPSPTPPSVPATKGAPESPSLESAPAGTAPGDRRSYGLADAGIRQRFGLERPAPTPQPAAAPAGDAPPALPAVSAVGPALAPGDADLGALLRELEIRPALNAQRSPPGSPELWTEIPITGRVYLSVRGLAAEDTPVAEAVARHLKRALRARAAND